MASLLLLMALAGIGAAEPLALYVSPKGDDSWSGRSGEVGAPNGPFATLARARDEVRKLKAAGQLPEGAVVNVASGLYEFRETLKLGPEDSGTEQAPIVYRGVGDEKPILTGGKVLTGWREYEKGILWCDLKANELAGKPVSVFVFGGELQTLARYPNHDPQDPHQGTWAYVASVDGDDNRTSFHYGEDETHVWERPEDASVHIHPYFDWAWNIVKLAKHEPATRTLTMAGNVSYALHIGDRYFIDNLFEELDAPGEWFRDPRTEAFYFKPPRLIDAAPAVAATIDDIVVMDGAQYVTLQGFVLECCNGTPIRFTNSSHCVAAGNIVRNCGGWGITVAGGQYSGARGNDVHDCGHGGISIDGGNRDTLEPGHNFADNNYVHHCARVVKTYRPGVSVNGVGNVVSHNLIHDMPHAALLLGGNENVVEYNHVRHCNLESADTGGIYFCSRDWTQRGNIIRYNLFHHCGGFGKANSWAPVQGGKVKFEYPHFTWGIYLDDPTTGTLVYGNIVYAAPICGLHNHGGRDNTWENNIVVDAPAFQAGMLDPNWSEWPPIRDRLHQRTQPGSPYLKAYPGLADYNENEPEAMTGVRMVRNIFYYTKDGTAWLRERNGNGWGGEGCQLLYDMRMKPPHFRQNEWDGNCVYLEEGLEPRINLSLYPGGGKLYTWDEWRALGADKTSVLEDPLFVDAKNHDYRLKPDSPALKLGFKPIPVDEIGPHQSDLRATWPITEAPGVAALGDFRTVRYYQPPQYRPLPAKGPFMPRDGAPNFFAKAAAGQALKVAYFGGGIHYADGWRKGVMDWLRAKYGDVTEIDASTCDCVRGSGWSIYRFGHDALAHKPDLVFIDFTSDDQAGDAQEAQRCIEGMIRQAQQADPSLDVILLHAFRQGYETDYNEGVLPAVITADERVAEHYGIPSINLAYRISELAREGKLIINGKPDEAKQQRKLLFSEGGVRPSPDANAIYAETITAALEQLSANAKPTPHQARPPLNPQNYELAKQVTITADMLSKEWKQLPPEDELCKRFASKMDAIWYTDTRGATLTFRFKGTSASIYDLMGPDTGRARITLDGKEIGVRQQVDPWSYYQRQAAIPIASGLEDKVHEVMIELLPDPPDRTVPIAEAKKANRYDPALFEGVALRVAAIRVIGEVVP
ncbi:MAG: hypothetical protein FJX75_15590 [Armatimonadetes bacterium]|nr:hypothetical protein [Armatimonadota bacterium]